MGPWRFAVSAKISRLAATVLMPLAFSACSWFTDFKDQPAIQPWDSVADTIAPRGQPVNSVPITGSITPGYTFSYRALPNVVDSMSVLPNPRAPGSLSAAELDSSLASGQRYYQQNCAVCHGDAGNGLGPATKYGVPAINLMTDMTKSRTDGYVYGMMRNGRGSMPSYNRIEEPDRWDVVNYLRGLQGKLGRTVPTGPPDKAAVFAYAKRFLNAPYYWGGRTVFGIDCSGFVQSVFAAFDVRLPRDSKLQAAQGTLVADRAASVPADLAFFGSPELGIHHVGLLLPCGEIIHASNMVRVDDMTDEGIRNRENGEITHRTQEIRRVM